MPRKKKTVETVRPKSVTVDVSAEQLARVLGIRGYIADSGVSITLELDPTAKHPTQFGSDHVVVGETGTLHQHGRTYVCTVFLPKVDESTVTESD